MVLLPSNITKAHFNFDLIFNSYNFDLSLGALQMSELHFHIRLCSSAPFFLKAMQRIEKDFQLL